MVHPSSSVKSRCAIAVDSGRCCKVWGGNMNEKTWIDFDTLPLLRRCLLRKQTREKQSPRVPPCSRYLTNFRAFEIVKLLRCMQCCCYFDLLGSYPFSFFGSTMGWLYRGMTIPWDGSALGGTGKSSYAFLAVNVNALIIMYIRGSSTGRMAGRGRVKSLGR